MLLIIKYNELNIYYNYTIHIIINYHDKELLFLIVIYDIILLVIFY